MLKDVRIVDVPPQPAMAIRETISSERVGLAMSEFLGEIIAYMNKNGMQPMGPPYAHYRSYDPKSVDMEVGFPCSVSNCGEGRVKPSSIPGGKVVKAIHIGPYGKLVESYNEVLRWMSEKSLRPKRNMWEVYLTDPDTSKDPSEYVTELYWPFE